MRKILAKTHFMYYPFARYITLTLGHLLLALSLVFFFTLISQNIACAESDEHVAAGFRAKGLQAQNLGRIKEALFYYQQASAVLPDNAAIRNDVALMQDNLGNNEEAEENYRKAIALDPNYLPSYFNMGRFYAKQGLYPLAAKYLKERIARGSVDDPFTLQAQEELEVVYNAVPNLQAEHLQEQAVVLTDMISDGKKRLEKRVSQDTTTSFETAYQDGVAAFVDKRFDEAIVSLETAVALNPRSVDARHALQRARLESDRGYLQGEAREHRDRLKEQVLESYLGPETVKDVPSGNKNAPVVPISKKPLPEARLSQAEVVSSQNRGFIVSAPVDQATAEVPPGTRE